jgi:hypothetical protein
MMDYTVSVMIVVYVYTHCIVCKIVEDAGVPMMIQTQLTMIRYEYEGKEM